MLNPTIIRGETMNHLYPELLRTLMKKGGDAKPRDQQTREICPVVLHLENALENIVTHPLRNLNYSFMVAEWFWIMRGATDVESIAHYNKQIARFSDDGKTYFGAYGPPILAQREYVLQKLREDKDTRQAVLTIWRQNPPGTKDVPCTVAAQFLLRDDQLNANFIMRSSDAWLGIPYDVFNFSRILSSFAAELGVPTGELCLFLGSSHLYEQHFEDAWDLGHDKVHVTVPGTSPELDGWISHKYLDDVELVARQHGIAVETPLLPLRDYLEALAYRTHKDITRGDGHIMQIIRAVRDAQPKEGT